MCCTDSETEHTLLTMSSFDSAESIEMPGKHLLTPSCLRRTRISRSHLRISSEALQQVQRACDRRKVRGLPPIEEVKIMARTQNRRSHTLACPDCHAAPGEYHELGCEVERCPYCGHQLLMCLIC